MQSKNSLIASALLLGGINAKIVTDSPLWAQDWYDANTKIGVQNGVPYSQDPAVNRFITAPLTLEGDVPEYMTFENVQRVQRVFSEDQFNFLFPRRNNIYTYDGLLHAIGKYPAFCGQKGPSLPDSEYTLDQACKRELATIFAHFNQETGGGRQYAEQEGLQFWQVGLYWLTEINCSPGGWGFETSSCDYAQTWDSWARTDYPPQTGVQYYGRGPFQLSWNYNYGAFSKVVNESTYDSHMVLLRNPDRVHTDSFTVFLSALWFYMTPQAPKPSMHDLASGWYVPTQNDLDNELVFGFGYTTNIINGGHECGNAWAEDQRSQYRIDTYTALLDYFQLPAEDPDTMGCRDQPNGGSLPTGDNYGMIPSYFEANTNLGRCEPSIWQSAYHVGTQDDYKRCMCRHFPTDPNNVGGDCPVEQNPEGGDGGDDINQGDNTGGDSGSGNDNTGGDNTGGDSTGGNDNQNPPTLTDTAAAFAEIWARRNYDDTKPSRTMYQVDQSLNLIEQKLMEMYSALHQAQMVQ